ncbi:hypothetical protein BBF96_08165 [Anoxybacter fermentans]|uniref:YprB ribonuclease H-like domain-containing protein n=1 Tax=Anoxybacter fermentans TaxID=1323375 RepID=A0A3S9SYH6_9FIRM|nr:ribonuclease H-like domain-containing protein [Anoxybacter fermentans]AZR73359.1 hypothetical protein BBF96_08165 [Anoxybacter fermentans]
MDLKAKLRLHHKKENEGKKKARNEPVYEPFHKKHHLTRLLPGKMIQSEFGEYFLVEYRYPLNHFHGRTYLGALLREDLSALCGILKDQELVCPKNIESLVFVDTETTGLAGGTGTFAFLVGMGYFKEDEFILRQYMMEDYHQEFAMLDALYSKLQEFSHLVTFNGKSFDWPLLEGRFIYHRMKGNFSHVHVDLLHPARRYYKNRLMSCNLGSLEEAVLGFYRTNDIPGALVPELFFRYLEEKDGRILIPVFQHNHWDILSLVTLMTNLIQAYLRPYEVLDEPEDLFSAGKVYEDLGQYNQAVKCYSICLNQEISAHLKQEILKRLSFLYKRLGRMEEACSIWQSFINSKNNLRLFPYIELAKYYEHYSKDYRLALKMARDARQVLLKQRRLYTRNRFKELMDELEHREKRLLRKMGRLDEKGVSLL